MPYQKLSKALLNGLIVNMKKIIIKIGAYSVLILGILVTSLILIFALALLFNFPEATVPKKVSVIGGLVLAGVLTFILSFSIFESMHEVIVMEDELDQIIKGKKPNV